MKRSQLLPSRAFSLLEMMVAIGLLSLGLVLLLQVQARSIQLAQQAREITIATQLSRGKLLDCQTDLLKKGFSIGDYDEEGDFSEEQQPGFFWECHAYKPDMPVADVSDVQEAAAGGDAAANGDAAAPSPLGGLTGAAGAAAGPDVGMMAIAPFIAQMSTVMGDSIRELVVIIRWGQGEDMQEMTVTTHVIDKTAVNQVAAMIKQSSDLMKRATGGGTDDEAEGTDTGTGTDRPGRTPRTPRTPGAGALNPTGSTGGSK